MEVPNLLTLLLSFVFMGYEYSFHWAEQVKELEPQKETVLMLYHRGIGKFEIKE